MLSVLGSDPGNTFDVGIKAALLVSVGLGIFFLANRRLAFLGIFFLLPVLPETGRALFPSLLAYYDLLLIALGIHVLYRSEEPSPSRLLDYLVIAYVLVGIIALYRSVALFSVPFQSAFF